MLGYFLVCLALGCQTIALPTDSPSTPPSTTPSSLTPSSPTTTPTTPTTPACKPMNDCEPCLAVPGCMFVKYEEGDQVLSEVCQAVSAEVSSDPVSPRLFIKTCNGSGEDPNNPTTTTPSDTTTDTTTTITTSTTTTTTDSTTTTTTPTTPPTTTTPIPDTTIPTTPTTTTATTVTTTTTTPTPSTSTTPSSTSSTTETPEPEPDTGKGHFDGWSFFGGILLTLGLAAIGLVGFKYYRLRSGTGGNYNRF